MSPKNVARGFIEQGSKDYDYCCFILIYFDIFKSKKYYTIDEIKIFR